LFIKKITQKTFVGWKKTWNITCAVNLNFK
jgi:hypothetical protein